MSENYLVSFGMFMHLHCKLKEETSYAYIHYWQVAIMTPEERSWDCPYIKIAPYYR